jgi:ubiquinone/menaquinone biosynthesis C-methylase UbiE
LNTNEIQRNATPICDYEGSDYRTRFWQGQGREYEDLAERIAIGNLVPLEGQRGRLLEIGTGYARLVDMYAGYGELVLLDYSKSMLRDAQARLGRDPRYTYVAADLYRMPLADAVVDGACMVRVIHHLANIPGALRQIQRVIRPGGTFLLEYANKIHLKSILRYAVRRQDWSPYEREPVEFVALNFNFHPQWVAHKLAEHEFEIERTRTVSRFRIPLLKRIIPPQVLAGADGALQWLGELWQLTPSVFVRAERQGVDGAATAAQPLPDRSALFRCPACEQSTWEQGDAELRCLSCGKRWAIDDGIYDFKTPIE